MAMEQYLQETAAQSDFNEEIISQEKCQSLSQPNTSRDFDCNICLDLVQDPVVTFCGHLYCWPCIYRWIINSRDVNGDHRRSRCPVCKTEVSQKTLIPLYGRGQTSATSQNEANILIPRRPNTCTPTSHSYPIRNPRYIQQPSDFVHRVPSRMFGESHLVDPMLWMFGEMVYARIFGNSDTTLYSYPDSYHLADSSSPRLRRHMMQTDTSLSRVCFFLLCCVISCLLLF